MSLSNFTKTFVLWRLMVPVNWGTDVVQILRSPLSPKRKRQTLWTATVLAVRSILPKPSRAAGCGVLDFRVRAYSLDMLSLLHREIFVKLEYYFETEKEAPFIVDCGSNIGMSILFFKALYPKAKVIGFEPSADTFALLSENVRANGLQDVRLHQVAVGDKEGSITFFNASEAGSVIASTNPLRMSSKSTTVQQVRLSTFIDRPVDLLKIDVEGAETKVFADLVESGAIAKIDRMIIEYHHHIDRDDDSFSTFLAVLETHGYGYQLVADIGPRQRARAFQDFLIYAYRKTPLGRATTVRDAFAAAPTPAAV